MKKTWENASIETLEINATAGGSIMDNNVDGDLWWNESGNCWSGNFGHDPKSN